ncbi:MAG: hypothetical protein D6732_11570 [Methanobacteriota archaeon]|nr:MAG: hypothetical protein D6732_11570 [Euryarchaeota archaeon]
MYFGTPTGRAFVISFLVGIFSAVLSFYLAIQNPVSTSLGFLYEPLPLEETNWKLTIAIIVLMQITFLSLVFAFAYREEMNHRIPSWTQIFVPMVITQLLALFIVNVTVTGGVEGSERDIGLSNFNKEMGLTIGWTTLILMILWAYYFYLVSKQEEAAK